MLGGAWPCSWSVTRFGDLFYSQVRAPALKFHERSPRPLALCHHRVVRWVTSPRETRVACGILSPTPYPNTIHLIDTQHLSLHPSSPPHLATTPEGWTDCARARTRPLHDAHSFGKGSAYLPFSNANIVRLRKRNLRSATTVCGVSAPPHECAPT